MSIEKKNKDHLKAHGGVSLVPPEPPKSDDPLVFWTNRPKENQLVNLHPFAAGQFEKPLAGGDNWLGPYSGRPTLITELAPVLQAFCTMRAYSTVTQYQGALRAWWRLFDSIEATSTPDGRPIARLVSVADLGPLHEAAAHRHQISNQNFNAFIKVADAARKLQRLSPLRWIPPKGFDPIRHLIPEDQAREIKVALKQDWERVRRSWAMNDKVREEAERRARGEPPIELDEEESRRLENWLHLQEIQRQTGLLLPRGKQLYGEWKGNASLRHHGLIITLMRSIQFPTVEEADIAFHLALMNSGWNPSTLQRIDATNPFLLANHPKDEGQLVLATEAGDAETAEEEATLHADKPRAGGWTQFCAGKKSQPASAPMVVDAYLKRVGPLRDILRQECQAARAEFDRLRATGADQKHHGKQLKRVQKLEAGCRSVWLYLDRYGDINWIGTGKWNRFTKADDSTEHESYLDRVRERLNIRRAEHGRPLISKVVPSDFRDIYARWVYVATNGNIIAVALALGHKSLASTGPYVENNIFAAEADDTLRRWGTHLFNEIGRGRIDLTILAQLVRHGPLTPEMEERLQEYRRLWPSRVGVGCSDPRRPPESVAPGHVAGRLCGTHRCLKQCPNAKFLPESLDGIAMRVEELMAMMDHLPREAWMRGGFEEELASGEVLLQELFPRDDVADACERWRQRITEGEHLIPGLGRIHQSEEVAA